MVYVISLYLYLNGGVLPCALIVAMAFVSPLHSKLLTDTDAVRTNVNLDFIPLFILESLNHT